MRCLCAWGKQRSFGRTPPDVGGPQDGKASRKASCKTVTPETFGHALRNGRDYREPDCVRGSNCPRVDRTRRAADDAARSREARRALRTGRVIGKRVELGPARTATPKIAGGRRGMTNRARVPFPARRFGDAGETLCELVSFPTAHADERRNDAQPDRLRPECQNDKTRRAHKSDDRGHRQTLQRPDDKPEQRPENLAAIERIDREEIEDEDHEIHQRHGINKLMDIARPWRVRKESPKSSGKRATLTNGPAAMLHNCAPGRAGGST